jgi:hypothetical protein
VSDSCAPSHPHSVRHVILKVADYRQTGSLEIGHEWNWRVTGANGVLLLLPISPICSGAFTVNATGVPRESEGAGRSGLARGLTYGREVEYVLVFPWTMCSIDQSTASIGEFFSPVEVHVILNCRPRVALGGFARSW